MITVESFVAFDSDSPLSEVCHHLQMAEVILADLSDASSHLMYVLGMAHALGRCPLLVVGDGSRLPFNLQALRAIEYGPGPQGLGLPREQLERAIRIFLTCARAGADDAGEEA